MDRFGSAADNTIPCAHAKLIPGMEIESAVQLDPEWAISPFPMCDNASYGSVRGVHRCIVVERSDIHDLISCG